MRIDTESAAQMYKPPSRLSSELSGLSGLSNHPDYILDDEIEVLHVDHCGSQFVLLEANPIRPAWSVVVFFLLVYTATLFVYRLCFCLFHINESGPDPIGLDDQVWNGFDYLVDALFWCDLILNFFLSYKNRRGAEVDSLRLIARKYLSGFFWINLLACLPEEAGLPLVNLFMGGDTPQAGVNKVVRVTRLQRISRLARLVRLTRLAKLAPFLSKSQHWRWVQSLRGVRIVNFIIGLIWALHLLACFWYLCAALHADPKSTWVGRRTVDTDGTSLLEQQPLEQWLVAMYFVLTVFTTVGFGDISAGTEAEIVFAGLTMILGAVVHSIIISEVIRIVTSTDQVQEFVDKQLKLIEAFSQHTGLDREVQKALREETLIRGRNWAMQQNFDKEEVTRLITGKYWPRSLMDEMPGSLFGGQLVRNRFLTCQGQSAMPPRLALLMAVHLVSADFVNAEVVYQVHDFSFNLFLVLSGTFACVGIPTHKGGVDDVPTFEAPPVAASSHSTQTWILQKNDTQPLSDTDGGSMVKTNTSTVNRKGVLYPYRLFGSRSFFGHVEVVRSCPRLATVRCERAGQTLVLQRADFRVLQEQFPQCRGKWQAAARKSEHSRKHALQQLRYGLPVRHFAALRIQAFARARMRKLARAPKSNGVQEGPLYSHQPRSDIDEATAELSAKSSDAGVHDLARELKLIVNSLRIDMNRSISALRTDFNALRAEIHEALAQEEDISI